MLYAKFSELKIQLQYNIENTVYFPAILMQCIVTHGAHFLDNQIYYYYYFFFGKKFVNLTMRVIKNKKNSVNKQKNHKNVDDSNSTTLDKSSEVPSNDQVLKSGKKR